jgi:AraC-like DNA-binding protein
MAASSAELKSVINAPLALAWPGAEVTVLPGAQPEGVDERLGAHFYFDSRWRSGDRPLFFELTAPGVAATPPHFLGPTERVTLRFTIAFALEAAGRSWSPGLAFQPVRGVGDADAWALADLLRSALRDACSAPGYARCLAGGIAARVHAAFSNVEALPPAQGGLTGPRLRRCLEHMEANLHRDLSLDELADVTGLSRSHFARAFRATTGASAFQRLRQLRAERAKALLAEPDRPIAEIAVQCGYARQSHFTSAFRAETGVTPAAYRRTLP